MLKRLSPGVVGNNNKISKSPPETKYFSHITKQTICKHFDPSLDQDDIDLIDYSDETDDMTTDQTSSFTAGDQYQYDRHIAGYNSSGINLCTTDAHQWSIGDWCGMLRYQSQAANLLLPETSSTEQHHQQRREFRANNTETTDFRCSDDRSTNTTTTTTTTLLSPQHNKDLFAQVIDDRGFIKTSHSSPHASSSSSLLLLLLLPEGGRSAVGATMTRMIDVQSKRSSWPSLTAKTRMACSYNDIALVTTRRGDDDDSAECKTNTLRQSDVVGGDFASFTHLSARQIRNRLTSDHDEQWQQNPHQPHQRGDIDTTSSKDIFMSQISHRQLLLQKRERAVSVADAKSRQCAAVAKQHNPSDFAIQQDVMATKKDSDQNYHVFTGDHEREHEVEETNAHQPDICRDDDDDDDEQGNCNLRTNDNDIPAVSSSTNLLDLLHQKLESMNKKYQACIPSSSYCGNRITGGGQSKEWREAAGSDLSMWKIAWQDRVSRKNKRTSVDSVVDGAFRRNADSRIQLHGDDDQKNNTLVDAVVNERFLEANERHLLKYGRNITGTDGRMKLEISPSTLPKSQSTEDSIESSRYPPFATDVQQSLAFNRRRIRRRRGYEYGSSPSPANQRNSDNFTLSMPCCNQLDSSSSSLVLPKQPNSDSNQTISSNQHCLQSPLTDLVVGTVNSDIMSVNGMQQPGARSEDVASNDTICHPPIPATAQRKRFSTVAATWTENKDENDYNDNNDDDKRHNQHGETQQQDESCTIDELSAERLDKYRELARTKLKMLERKYRIRHDSEHGVLDYLKRKKPAKSARGIFGMPLNEIQRRHRGCLPPGIVQCMVFLLSICSDHVDLFRKPAVRSKIAELKTKIKEGSKFELQTENAFIIADVIRQYLRELPESLISRHYTEMLRDVFTEIPDNQRCEAVNCILLMLPDCNRNALEAVLNFLHEYVERTEKVNLRGLARLFVPSIFHSYPEKVSYNLYGQKNKFFRMRGDHDMEHSSLESCLIFMITSIDTIFLLPGRWNVQGNRLGVVEFVKRVYGLNDLEHKPVKTIIAQETSMFIKHIQKKVEGRLQRAVYSNGIEVKCYQSQMPGSHCLITIRSSMIVKTTSSKLASCIVENRQAWDIDFSDFRLVEQFEGADIVQYVTKPLYPLSARGYCELRYVQWLPAVDLKHGPWHSTPQVTESSGGSQQLLLIGSKSIEHHQNHFLPRIRGQIDYSYFIIKPCQKVVKLGHIQRCDVRGCSSQWYKDVYIHKVLHNLENLRRCCAH